MHWKVCPVQGRQLKDVRPEDIFGDFRICKTYRSGGGYDQFAKIAERYVEEEDLPILGQLDTQFVVQLYGCHLNCPYCYVTKDGVFGNYVEYTADHMVSECARAFREHKCGVFHLMGGAPALHIEEWDEIISQLHPRHIFHSDLLLTEKLYNLHILKRIRWRNAIYAVNIKGVTPEDYYKNTGRALDKNLLRRNLDNLAMTDYLKFYLTFTNPDLENLERYKESLVQRYGDWIIEDSFVIDLVDYNATKEMNNDV